uniref:Uncharacterized protein n=1 Tax=Arundo donax TaxID=35708 RepID=A0A0A8ZTW0_ARUDO
MEQRTPLASIVWPNLWSIIDRYSQYTSCGCQRKLFTGKQILWRMHCYINKMCEASKS